MNGVRSPLPFLPGTRSKRIEQLNTEKSSVYASSEKTQHHEHAVR
jgi:hypothetical protein